MTKPPKKIVNKGIDPRIYLAATEFYETAELISKSNKTRALVVNYAFSIELFIKSLYSTTEMTLIVKPGYPEYERSIKTLKGHNLLKLYQQLPSSDQIKISKLYLSNFRTDIVAHLDEIKGDFIEWRYAHEKNQLSSSTGALQQISKTLKQYIEMEMSSRKYAR